VSIIFEFFRESPDNERISLATEKRNIRTADTAVSYARGALNNVLFNGEMADVCSIRTQKGLLICEVRSAARRPQKARETISTSL
jgi:hypothetical protein